MSANQDGVEGRWGGSVFAGPNDSPGFRLWRDFLDWQRQLNARLKPLGLTQPQFAILAVSGWLTREGEPITQHGIASFTGMDRMHISQIISRLEKDGLIEKQNKARTTSAQTWFHLAKATVDCVLRCLLLKPSTVSFSKTQRLNACLTIIT